MFHGGGGAGEELPCFVAAGIPGAFAVAAAFLIIVVFLARVSAFMANGYPSWDDWDYGYYGGPSDGVQNAQALSTRAVQTALAWRGYYRGRIDGVMGPETRDAIRSFQAHQSLPVTGQIDHGLLNALRRGGSNDHKTT
jgi:Putative peptidoglycan binding domain